MMANAATEIECINMRLEILNDESQRLYRLLENFSKMKDQPREAVRKAILERLEKRKFEMKKELEGIALRVKAVMVKGQNQLIKKEKGLPSSN